MLINKQRDRIDAVRAGGIAALSDAILERWFSKPFRAGADFIAWRNISCSSDQQCTDLTFSSGSSAPSTRSGRGVATATAAALLGLECTVYMVKVSFSQKPYRKSMMQLWGADVLPSPSNQTNAGRQEKDHWIGIK